MKRLLLVALLSASLSGCNGSSGGSATAEDAKQFIDEVNATALKLGLESSQASWVQATYITDDTVAISARASQAYIDAMTKFAKEAVRFDKVAVPDDIRRQLNLLKLSLTMATPSDPKEGEEMTNWHRSWRPPTAKASGAKTRRTRKAVSTSTGSQTRWRESSTRNACSRLGKAGARLLRRCARTSRASSNCPTRVPGKWASPIPATCGAQGTTCRLRNSPGKSTGCGVRCVLCISLCMPTCG